MWEDKARRLKIPLSGKGHSVSQHGVYTGVAIDTVRGRYLMLPDKLAAMAKARDDLWASSQSTPRLIARVRGKAIHYGCAIPFVAVAAASLSQLMHDRECGSGPVQVPAVRDEGLIVDFDWDKLVSVSGRAKAALDFMRQAMESYSADGQPIWPLVPSSVYGAFLSGRLRWLRILVITYDASIHGWGAVVRTAPDEEGHTLVGGFRVAQLRLRGPYLESPLPGDDPAAQIHREAVAGLLATRAVSQLYPLRDYTVLVRGDCVGALSAFRKGSFRSPALQDVAL